MEDTPTRPAEAAGSEDEPRFSIAAPSDISYLDGGQRITATYTVTSVGSQAENVQAAFASDQIPGFFAQVEKPERRFAPGETQQFIITLQIPRMVRGGRYLFELRLYDQEMPDELLARGPAMAVDLPDFEPAFNPLLLLLPVIVAGVVGLALYIVLNTLLVPENVIVTTIQGNEYTIMRLALDGDGAENLVSIELMDGSHDRHPRLSPDGQTLAFISDRTWGTTPVDETPLEVGIDRIWLLELNRRGAVPFLLDDSIENVVALDWHPEGDRLAYVQCVGAEQTDCSLHQINRDGTLNRPLIPATDGDTTQPIGSIAYHPSGQQLLVVIDEPTPLEETNQSEDDTPPEETNVGFYLLNTGNQGAIGAVQGYLRLAGDTLPCVPRETESAEESVTEPQRLGLTSVRDVDWSPDGEQIVFSAILEPVSYYGPERDLFIILPDASDDILVAADAISDSVTGCGASDAVLNTIRLTYSTEETPPYFGASWMPDSTQLLVVTENQLGATNYNRRLYLGSLLDGNPVPGENYLEIQELPLNPAFSVLDAVWEAPMPLPLASGPTATPQPTPSSEVTQSVEADGA